MSRALPPKVPEHPRSGGSEVSRATVGDYVRGGSAAEGFPPRKQDSVPTRTDYTFG